MGGGRSICENVLSSYVYFSKNGKSTAPSKFVEFTADLTGILVCSVARYGKPEPKPKKII